jgi:hypothetical protein
MLEIPNTLYRFKVTCNYKEGVAKGSCQQKLCFGVCMLEIPNTLYRFKVTSNYKEGVAKCV